MSSYTGNRARRDRDRRRARHRPRHRPAAGRRRPRRRGRRPAVDAGGGRRRRGRGRRSGSRSTSTSATPGRSTRWSPRPWTQLRAARRDGRQRRDRAGRAAAGRHAGGVRPADGGQPARRLPLLHGRRAADDRPGRRRQDHRRGVDRRAQGLRACSATTRPRSSPCAGSRRPPRRSGPQHGITVNAYCPGIVGTAMWELIDEKLAEHIGPAEGRGAGAVLRADHAGTRRDARGRGELRLLPGVGPDSDYMTGQSVMIDGGVLFA